MSEAITMEIENKIKNVLERLRPYLQNDGASKRDLPKDNSKANPPVENAKSNEHPSETIDQHYWLLAVSSFWEIGYMKVGEERFVCSSALQDRLCKSVCRCTYGGFAVLIL